MRFRGKALLQQKHLRKYRLPDNINGEKDEGYDGHLMWDGSSIKMRVTMAEFRRAVKEGDRAKIMDTLDFMGAAGAEAQLDHICGLILAGDAEPLKEALLGSITIGSRPLTEFVLSLFYEYPHEERCGCSDSDAFAPHMTPLLLACILNNFAIVECLLLRGHTIHAPHHKNCHCDHCLRMPYAALASMQKVDILRGLCSEAFLWLGCSDPFAAACALSADLDQFIRDDNLEFTDWYRSLQQSVQRFATRLVDQNWSEHELDLFLSHKCHSALSVCETPYPRVQMALDCQMKELVSSTNVQRAMQEIWWRGWGNFGATPSRDCYRMLRHVLLYPILALVYVISHGNVARSFDVPLARYMSNLSSYVTFVAALIAIRFFKGTENHEEEGNTKLLLRLLESYCYLYLVGMLAERYLLFSRHGFRSYFKFWWRWFDFLLIGVFLLAMHLWICELSIPIDRELATISRNHWPSWDYFLLYDIFLSTGCILAIWKIFYYFQLMKGIGASVISVGRCVGTIYNYLVIMAVIMMSFAVGLNMLVQPYLGAVENRDGHERQMGSHFKSLPYTYRNLYWAFYGYLDPSLYPIVVGNSGPDNLPAEHTITSFATEMLMALFHVIIIITLLNLMISLMVKKADEVLDNEETEFKYTRVVIYSEFLHWSAAVPPPFNLLLILTESIYRAVSSKHVTVWPEIFLERSVSAPDGMAASLECHSYQNLLLKAFNRYRAGREFHYKTVFRTEFDCKDKPTHAAAKVAFMNEYDRGGAVDGANDVITDNNNNNNISNNNNNGIDTKKSNTF